MAAEQMRARAPVLDWTAPTTDWPDRPVPDVDPMPPNEHLVAVAGAMAPGKALDLGCGEGHDAIWLAERGWIVNAFDPSPAAIETARDAARRANVDRTALFGNAALADVRPASRFDLVYCTMALPARGTGRSRMLEQAAAAVAGGGTIVLTDVDASLARGGWMQERYLVSTEELERALDGFRIERSAVRSTRVRHGYEERVLPTALVIATRRTDLRSLY